MEQLNAELARVTAEHRRLQKQVFSRESRLRARRERALRVGTIAFCHDPTAGSSLAIAILRKYGDCVALDVPHCVAELENRCLKAPVETLAQWLDWEGEVPEQESCRRSDWWSRFGCCPGRTPRMTPKVYPLHLSSSGRGDVPYP